MTESKNFTIRKTIFILVTLLCNTVRAQTISVGGTDWAAPITAISEAGNNYAGTSESAANQILIAGSISLLGSSTISARYVPNPNWNSALQIALRRTGPGSPCVLCTISSNTNYHEITQTATSLISISGLGGTYSNIPFQIRISGISVTIPAASYSATVIFTITAG